MTQLFKLIFVSLLLLLSCHTLCVSVCANTKEETGEESVVLFEPNKDIKIIQGPNGEKDDLSDGIIIHNINLPHFFVFDKFNVMGAVAEAMYTNKKNSDDKKHVGVVIKYFKAETKEDWRNKNIINVESKWTAQIATKNSPETEIFFKVFFSVVNEKSDKIYVCLLNSTEDESSATKLNFKLVVGTVNINASDGKIITWKTEELTVSKIGDFVKDIDEKKLVLNKASGSAFLIKDTNIVCVLKCKYKNSDTVNDVKNIIAVFQLKEDGNKFELLDIEYIDGKHLSFFQWGGELFKTPTNEATDGVDEVMMFDTSKNNFVDSGSSITCLKTFLKNKQNFITVKAEENNLLLFTEKRKKTVDIKNVYLWITDGVRVTCVGIVISDIKDSFLGFFLYTNKELFALHQKYNPGENPQKKSTFLLKRLKEPMNNMTFVLDAWKKSNELVVALCKEINDKDNVCTFSLFTDGLVGFLYNVFNKNNKNEWKDEYFYSNATVEGGKMESNGMTFNGVSSGAKWPVSKQQEDQPYNFNVPGFTILATMTIDSDTNEKVNSVLGVGLSDNKNVGLWCTTNGKWGVSGKENQNDVKLTDVLCERGKLYQVVFILNKSNIFVFVNGI